MATPIIIDSVQTWQEAIQSSLQDLWIGIIGFLPELIGAFLILVLGWFIAIGLGRFVASVLQLTKVDLLFEKLKVHNFFKKFGSKMHVSDFIGTLVRWFLSIVAVVAAADVLGLDSVNEFLVKVLYYIPNVLAAVVIMLAAVVLAHFAHHFVKGAVKSAGLMSANALAMLSKWVILAFGVLAALVQLGIATALVQTLFIGIVAMFALAGGLAFGLGGKDLARTILSDLQKQIKSKK